MSFSNYYENRVRQSKYKRPESLFADRCIEKGGMRIIYKEKVSGAKAERVELYRMMEHVRQGDVVVIWKLDRLGRSLRHLVGLASELVEKGVGLKSLNDPIDTTTPQGRLIYNMFASLAEFERDIIRERTRAGLEAARARGRKGGRPKGLSLEAQKTAIPAESLYKEGKLPVAEISKRLNISKSTLYNYLRHRNAIQ